MKVCNVRNAVAALLTVASVSLSAKTLESMEMVGSLDGPVYDWWHGCSATSAGMLMGYYDREGYNGKYYDLVPGGVAEPTMIGTADEGLGSGTSAPTLNVTKAIASKDHIDDFWTGYGNSDDDPKLANRARPGDFDSIADFMGTSQDSANNSDGSTSFWNYGTGEALDAQTIHNAGEDYWATSGMYGVFEWLQYRGYENSGATGTNRIYNQHRLGYGDAATQGFTFADYKAEIDAGRPVLIHTEGHTMLGDGYNDDGDTQTVELNNTWTDVNDGEDTMEWGGTYSGAPHAGVTVVELDETFGEDASEGGTATFEYQKDGVSSTEGLPDSYVADVMEVGGFNADGEFMALKFFFDQAQLDAAGITNEMLLRMFYWDDNESEWTQEGTGTFYDGSPQGDLGDFGVDLTGGYAWVNTDHASSWGIAAIPEPTTGLALLALTAMTALRRKRF